MDATAGAGRVVGRALALAAFVAAGCLGPLGLLATVGPAAAFAAVPRETAESDATAGAAQQNPVVLFSTPGLHTVTLTSCNSTGCSAPVSQQVVVLDPRPAVTSTTVTPAFAYVGQLIQLGAQATGQPSLAYSWKILQGSTQVATVSGSPATWNTAGLTPATYTVQISVSNGGGTASSSASVVLMAPVAAKFYTLPPCRVIDTRLQAAPLVAGSAPRVIRLAGACGIPAAARSVALNVTAVYPATGGSISVYPADYAQSLTNLLDFDAGSVTPTFTVLPLSTDGLGQLAAATSATKVDLLIDVSGYFAP
jgi:PKD repeat protein